MLKELYTVEEAAKVLNLHIKTVRRFLREGKIEGRKIGRAWMIPERGLREYAHGELSIKPEPVPVKKEKSGEPGGMSVSAVVEFYERESDEASRISNSLIAFLNCKDPSWGASRYDLIYHPDEGKARFVLYGSPLFIGEMMTFFKNIQDQER